MHRAALVFDVGEDLGDRADHADGDTRAPQGLADVLDAACRRAGQVHRVDGLLDGFPDQLAQFVFHGLLVE